MNAPVEQQLHDYFTTVDRIRGVADAGLVRGDETPITLRLVDGEAEQSDEGDEIMLTPNRESQTKIGLRAWMLGAAAVVGLVVGLLVASVSSDDSPAPADEPTSSAPVSEPAAGGPAPDLGFPGTTIEAGRYSTFLMGVPLELTIDDRWSISEARASAVAMHHPADERAIDVETVRWIFLTRLGGWYTSDEAIDPTVRAPGSIEPTDLDRWIAESGVIVENRRETDVDGRPATVIDVRVDPEGTGAPLDFPRDTHTLYADTCTEETAPCRWYRSISAESELALAARPDPVMHTGQTRRMWLISVGDLDPLLIEAVVPEGDDAWLDEFEATTIASLGLGDEAPPIAT